MLDGNTELRGHDPWGQSEKLDNDSRVWSCNDRED